MNIHENFIREQKSDCCGCSACAQVCPQHCITMEKDGEGFYYPFKDSHQCTECGLCDNVCPMLKPFSSQKPLACYASYNPDERARLKASSGGVFTMIAKIWGGTIYGCKWNDNNEAAHDALPSAGDLLPFCGSKYVQSIIGNTFKCIRETLRASKKVVFSGTPCQVAGLLRYLGKNDDNLLTIDCVCHGVPSLQTFREYIEEKLQLTTDDKVIDIQFRDKKSGWRNYSLTIEYEKKEGTGYEQRTFSIPHGESEFFKGFLSDLYLRPSCYSCPFKNIRSGADITLGDLWGAHKIIPEIDDDKGINAIIVNTEKGENAVSEIAKYEVSFQDVVNYNHSIVKSASLNKHKREKYYLYRDSMTFKERVNALCRESRFIFIKRCIKQIVKKILNVRFALFITIILRLYSQYN